MAGAGALAWRPRPVTLLAALLAGAMLTITSAAPAAPADSHKALELKGQLQHQASRTNHWKRVANCDLGAGANASANEHCQHSQAETFSPLVLAAMAASNAERLAEAVAVETKEAARWRKVAGDVSCKSAKVGPTGGFCANTHGTNECLNKGFADFIANDILFASTNSSTASVIDLGCGQGQYGAYWRSGEAKAKFGAGKALRWQGIDGVPHATCANDTPATRAPAILCPRRELFVIRAGGGGGRLGHLGGRGRWAQWRSHAGHRCANVTRFTLVWTLGPTVGSQAPKTSPRHPRGWSSSSTSLTLSSWACMTGPSPSKLRSISLHFLSQRFGDRPSPRPCFARARTCVVGCARACRA